MARDGISRLALCGLAITTLAHAQQTPTFRTRTTAVEVDLIVRDSRGRPVTDVTEREVELYEDGVRQRITAFRPPAGGPDETATTQSPGSEPVDVSGRRPEAAAQVAHVVALVFDRLAPEARALAHSAARTYLNEVRGPGDHVGVFVLDLSLVTVQPYTTSSRLLLSAIDTAATHATSRHDRLQDQFGTTSRLLTAVPVEDGGEEAPLKTGTPTAVAPAESPGTESFAPHRLVASDAVDVRFAHMTRRMERAYEVLMRDQAGQASLNGLHAIVESLREWPGRKAVVYFSDGLALPSDVMPRLKSVIDAANQANVSIYSLDAAGLRARSSQAETSRELAQALAEIRSRSNAGIMLRGLERNEDALRRDPSAGLSLLSAGTGGLLIDQTNDLAGGLRRIDADQRSYYLLTYTPSNTALDGRFRRIAVKVKRPGVRVEARHGYYASEGQSIPLLSHEIPAVALLDSRPLPHAFPMSACALTFPDPRRRTITAVIVQVPAASLTFEPDSNTGSYRGELVVVARVRSREGRTMDKVSERYVLTRPSDGATASRLGDILFYRELSVPGQHILEIVAHDVTGDAGSARILALDVPVDTEAGPRLSSIVLVQRAEQLKADERDENHPLKSGELVLYPSLGEAFQAGPDEQLTFYFIVLPDPDAAAHLKATLSLLRDGQPVAHAPLSLDRPDATGRIRQLGGIPLAGFSPGQYELRVTISDGTTESEQRTSFTIAQPGL